MQKHQRGRTQTTPFLSMRRNGTVLFTKQEQEKQHFQPNTIDCFWVLHHVFLSHLSPCPHKTALCPYNITPKQNQV